MLLSAPDGGRWVAHVLPLTSGARRRAGTAYAAVAAVFVQKAALETRSPFEHIARHNKLTPSELRVLIAVVEVGGVRETADALGLGEPTVKTHLNRLFTKTGTRRQADLVNLMAGFSSPLAGLSAPHFSAESTVWLKPARLPLCHYGRGDGGCRRPRHKKDFCAVRAGRAVVEREGAPWKRLMCPPESQAKAAWIELLFEVSSILSRSLQRRTPMMCFERPPIPSWPTGGRCAATCRGPPTLY